MSTDPNWPLVLSTEATIPSQTTQSPPQLALMNPTGEAFKIHEIRFSLTSQTTTANSVTGATIGCKLDLGSVALTNGFIPVWNFGRVVSYDQDLNNQFSWKLSQPLYVPAGALLSSNFQHFGQIDSAIAARITVFASPIQNEVRTPDRVFLPWIAAYIGKAFPYASADTDVSKETMLLNPFDTDVVISRLIGRFNVFSTAGQSNFAKFGSHYMKLRIALSNGDSLVRTSTPFQQVFGEEGRAWEQRNTILRPKQFFQVYVEKVAGDNVTIPTIQPFISMVGYREMKLVNFRDAVGQVAQ